MIKDEMNYLKKGSEEMFKVIQMEYVEKQCDFSRSQFLAFSQVLAGNNPEFEQSVPSPYDEEYKENYYEPHQSTFSEQNEGVDENPYPNMMPMNPPPAFNLDAEPSNMSFGWGGHQKQDSFEDLDEPQEAMEDQ